MAAFIVTYDLHRTGQNYACITEKLGAYPASWHMQGSVWIVSGAYRAADIRDNLMSCLDDNDTLFVGELTSGAWYGFNQAASDWLRLVIS